MMVQTPVWVVVATTEGTKEGLIKIDLGQDLSQAGGNVSTLITQPNGLRLG